MNLTRPFERSHLSQKQAFFFSFAKQFIVTKNQSCILLVQFSRLTVILVDFEYLTRSLN